MTLPTSRLSRSCAWPPGSWPPSTCSRRATGPLRGPRRGTRHARRRWPHAPGSPRGRRASARTRWWRSDCSNARRHYREHPDGGRVPAGAHPGGPPAALRFWDRSATPRGRTSQEALGRGPTEEIFDLDDELQRWRRPASRPSWLVRAARCRRSRLPAAPAGAGHRRRHRFVVDRRRAPAPGPPARRCSSARSSPGRRKHIARPGSPTASTSGPATSWRTTCRAATTSFLLANLIHYWSPEQNRALLKSVRAARRRGAGCCSPTSGPTRPTPSRLTAALMAGEFAVTREGRRRLQRGRDGAVAHGHRLAVRGAHAARGPVSLVVAEAA